MDAPVSVEPWRAALRAALPHLPREGVAQLRVALENDDPTLLQGCTTSPPPLACVQDWPCEGACLFGYAFWKGGLDTVGEIEANFGELCAAIDVALCEPAGCRHALNFWDETPRDEAAKAVLQEIDLFLSENCAHVS